MTLEQLGLPEQISRFAAMDSGLALITGPTGSGKSTTLAAVIDLINRRKCDHIITIEDPIEFVHPKHQSLLHQREVGTHTTEFNAALTASIREDPDLILVGEMRDRETMLLALQAAEKGMLVFGTLHTNSAAKTVERIINAFPSTEQEQVRNVLASTLKGVVSQQLLRRNGGGRVAALEILFSSQAMSNLIREGKTHHIPSLMQTGKKQGMVQMDESLIELVKTGIITREAALEKAIEKDIFKDKSLDDYAENPISLT
jgi:twitching motility protein PilT